MAKYIYSSLLELLQYWCRNKKRQSCSETFLLLHSKDSSSLNKTLGAALIGNIITYYTWDNRSRKTNNPTIVCLRCICFLRWNKEVQDLGSCNQEFSRSNRNQGLIKGVCDDYDTNIQSQNGFSNYSHSAD